MKVVSKSALKAKMLEYFRQVETTGEPLLVTSNGQPVKFEGFPTGSGPSFFQGKWKLEMCPGSGGWSYPRPGEEPEGSPLIQLYDMEADISERVNIVGDHPEVVERLTKLITRYVKNGRSTPGSPQPNTGAKYWPQLNWLLESDL